MKRVATLLALTALLALAFGLTAQAGGKGAVKTGLFVAHYPEGRIPSVVVVPEVQVGHALFNVTAKGTMNVRIVLKGGLPDATYQAFVVPTSIWGSTAAQGYSITTNRRGHGTIQFQRDIPAGADDPVSITAIVRIGTPADPATVVYRTYEQLLELK